MGINGLLINTKSVGIRKHLSDYRNKIIGVDGYAWLHKGIYKCGIEVSLHKNIKGLISYFEKKIKYLLSLNIKIVLVFDGADIPLKNRTNKERELTRKKNYEKGLNYFKQGDKDNARKYLSLAIDINPEMVYTLKKELERIYHKKSLQFLVAPYEADSQLAYLSKKKFIDVVITEDSDLLVFGATLIFYKMDSNFYGVEYKRENLELCEEINLRNWPNEKFIQLCILSGCDYLENPKGIGFKTAYSLMSKYDNIKSVINSLKKKLDKDYYNKFLAAFCAFKFSRVFCPKEKNIVTLNFINLEKIDLDNAFEYHAVLKSLENFKNFDFLGKKLNQEIAKKIAFCIINPLCKTQFQGIYKSSKEKSNNFNRMFLQQNLDSLIKSNDLSKEKKKIIIKKKEIIKNKKSISIKKKESKKF